MLAELAHEGHAKLADLVVGFTLRVEIGAAFATAYVYYICADTISEGISNSITEVISKIRGKSKYS